MTTLTIPDTWHKYILEYEAYRNVWISWCIYDDHWWKGVGKTKQESFDDLEYNILLGKHLGKLEPARYVPKSGGKAYRRATIPSLADIDISDIDL